MPPDMEDAQSVIIGTAVGQIRGKRCSTYAYITQMLGVQGLLRERKSLQTHVLDQGRNARTRCVFQTQVRLP